MSQLKVGRVAALEVNTEETILERLDCMEKTLSDLTGRVDSLIQQGLARDLRLDALERRMDRVENQLERVEDRLTGVESELRHVHVSLDARITDVHGALTTQTHWMLGIMGSLLVTFVAMSGGILVKLLTTG